MPHSLRPRIHWSAVVCVHLVCRWVILTPAQRIKFQVVPSVTGILHAPKLFARHDTAWRGKVHWINATKLLWYYLLTIANQKIADLKSGPSQNWYKHFHPLYLSFLGGDRAMLVFHKLCRITQEGICARLAFRDKLYYCTVVLLKFSQSENLTTPLSLKRVGLSILCAYWHACACSYCMDTVECSNVISVINVLTNWILSVVLCMCCIEICM